MVPILNISICMAPFGNPSPYLSPSQYQQTRFTQLNDDLVTKEKPDKKSKEKEYSRLLNDLLSESLPSPKSNESDAQAGKRVADFQKKLTLLTGMVQQAEVAVKGSEPLPGGLPAPGTETYDYAKSCLARLGVPGAVVEVV